MSRPGPGAKFTPNPMAETMEIPGVSHHTKSCSGYEVQQKRKTTAITKRPSPSSPIVPPIPLLVSPLPPPAIFKTPNIQTARSALQLARSTVGADGEEELEEWSPDIMEHQSPRSTRLECTSPAPAAPQEDSVPDMLFPEEVPCSTIPGHMASQVFHAPVAPSPIDEDQAWRPPITASSGCRPPPVRPKSSRSARIHRAPPSCRDVGLLTTRTKPVRIKQGSWGNKINPNPPPRGSKVSTGAMIIMKTVSESEIARKNTLVPMLCMLCMCMCSVFEEFRVR